MFVYIGLSLKTGQPWQYFADQDDEVIATYIDILKRAQRANKPTIEANAGKGPQMSG